MERYISKNILRGNLSFMITVLQSCNVDTSRHVCASGVLSNRFCPSVVVVCHKKSSKRVI